MPSQTILVVGAGVLGLTAILALAEKFPDTKIVVVAEHGPHDGNLNPSMNNCRDYTSGWAGAHYRPFPSRSEQDIREAALTRATQRRFRSLLLSNPETSIEFIPSSEYWEEADPLLESLGNGYSDEMAGFARKPLHKCPPGTAVGVEYETWCLNPPVYLFWLYRQIMFGHRNVTFVAAKTSLLKEAFQNYAPEASVIVNCSGMGVQWEGGLDPSCFPIRGQTLLVRTPPNCVLDNTTFTHVLRNNLWTFLIPRPLEGGTILGGTKQPHDTERNARESDTRDLTERALKICPEIFSTDAKGDRYLDIVGVNVGFRPARTGGLDLLLTRATNERPSIISNYGAGGMGYELSYGAALKVVGMVESLRKSKL